MCYSPSDFIETAKYCQQQRHNNKHAESCNSVFNIPSAIIILLLHRLNIDQIYDIRVFSKTVQAGCEVYTTSHSIIIRGNLPWSKAAGSCGWPLISNYGRYSWIFNSTPLTCVLVFYRGNFSCNRTT